MRASPSSRRENLTLKYCNYEFNRINYIILPYKIPKKLNIINGNYIKFINIKSMKNFYILTHKCDKDNNFISNLFHTKYIA